MKTKLGVAVVISVATMCVATVPTHGQTRSIFQRISTGLLDRGYSGVITPVSGWLNDDDAETFTVWLAAGQRYAVTAACDRDCSDLDLQLFSPAGIEVARDWGPDDEPRVAIVATQSGRFEVRVSMARCTVDPCEYLAGVFRR